MVTTPARRRRRILDLASIGFILIGVTMVTRESEAARGFVALFCLLYAVLVVILLFRVSRCPRCGSLLQGREIWGGRITIPWSFRSTCSDCGWDESSEEREAP